MPTLHAGLLLLVVAAVLAAASATPLPSTPSPAPVGGNGSEVVRFLADYFFEAPRARSPATRRLVRRHLLDAGVDLEAAAGMSRRRWRDELAPKLGGLLKRRSTSQRAAELLRLTLGFDREPAVAEAQRHAIVSAIPAAIVRRVAKWNAVAHVLRHEDIILIGVRKDSAGSESSWWFRLPRSLSLRTIRKATLSVHLSPSSRRAALGRQLQARQLLSSNGSQRSVLDASSPATLAGNAEELVLDVTGVAKRHARLLRRRPAADEVEVAFVVACDTCGRALEVEYVVMDTSVRVGDPGDGRRRRRRSLRSPAAGGAAPRWPYDHPPPSSATTAVREAGGPQQEEEEEEQEEAATRRCSARVVRNRLTGQPCCLAELTYDLLDQSNVVTPKQLVISYCSGECNSEGASRTAHGSMLHMASHSSRSDMSHEKKQQMGLCCVPSRYRDFKVLVLRKGENGRASIAMKTVPDISATSCVCS